MTKIPEPPDGYGGSIDFNDESIPLHVRRNEAMRLLQVAELAAKERGITWARVEAEYYSTKAQDTFELYEKGTPATVIQQVIKGMPDTNAALERRLAEEIGYKNAVEAIQCFKLIVRILEADIEREWNAQKRM